MAAGLIESIKNPFVRSFLQDNIAAFVGDVQTFSADIFANARAENKPFVKGAGLAFYSAPLVNLAPELPWHRIRSAIDAAVHETLHPQSAKNDSSEVCDGGNIAGDKIERAIAAAFISACESANSHAGAILVGGLADLLGKYISLYIAAVLDESVEPALH